MTSESCEQIRRRQTTVNRRQAMPHLLETLLRNLDDYRYKRNIERALALHLRGEVRSDGLDRASSTTHLEIAWRARDIHPWDPGLVSRDQTARAFVEQALADTEAAISRLFEALPQVDVTILRIFEQGSDRLIISGTVSRADNSARDGELAIGMRLRYLGITYHSAGPSCAVTHLCSGLPCNVALVGSKTGPHFTDYRPIPTAERLASEESEYPASAAGRRSGCIRG